MLGWEFPPRRSGGLGTACEGIATGLARIGVEVAFVVPSETGSETVRVVAHGASIPNPKISSIPSPHPPGAAEQDRVRGAAVSTSVGSFSQTQSLAAIGRPRLAPSRLPHAGVEDSLRLLRVASPLRPYQTRASYSEPAGASAGDDGPGARPGDPYAGDLFVETERYAAAVARLAVTEDFDVVHAHDWMTLPAALQARELSAKPLVWHVHGCEFDRRPHDADPAIAALEQLGLDLADRIVTVSRYTAEQLARHYRVDPKRMRIVHNAVERADFAPRAKRPAGGRPLVLFLGRLTAQKDPITFLRAARRVADSLPETRFVVGGSGDLLPELVAEVDRLELEDHVHFTGFLDGKEVQRMYALADVYVMPSHSEPFGISALEAMCADVPVVISNATGVAEVLTNALIFERGNAEALADRVLSLLRRPALRQTLIEQGRQEVRTLRWEVRARSLLRIYRELVA